eukprot:7625045-Pyramimonas_sp.AAC.1
MQQLSPHVRTRHIRGPVSALIHQLMLVGWDPVSPDQWHGPSSDGTPDFTWNFNTAQLVGLDQTRGMMQEFVDALQTRQWQQAANHFCGA